jgi:hypothetical protein
LKSIAKGTAVADAAEIELPLSQIELDPENIRSEYDPDIVAGLRSALQIEGSYINAPTVYSVGPRRYRVKHGSTRVLAARGVVPSLRVRVVDAPRDESSKVLSQMGENLLQGNLRPADIGRALKRLRNADGRERSLSQLVGALKAAGIERTKSWVAMHLALAELAPEVQGLINQGALGGEVAYQLRGRPQDEQILWAQRIIEEGITLAELRRQLGTTGSSDDESMQPEYLQRELANRLADATTALDQQSRTPRRLPDGARRNSAVSTRWDLLAVAVADEDARKLKPLTTAAWASHASELQKQLAREALFIGGYSAKQAIGLVDRATGEVQAATDSVLGALHALKNMVEHPADLPANSALAEFMAIRMRRVLQNIGRL